MPWQRVEQLKRIGVTEVACLVDYGIAPEKVMEGLYPLAEVVKLRQLRAAGVADGDYSIAAQSYPVWRDASAMHAIDGADAGDER